MKTDINELNLNDLEKINGGSLATTLEHIAGGIAAAAAGAVLGPAAAIAVGVSFVTAEGVIDAVT